MTFWRESCEHNGKKFNFWLLYIKYWYCKDNMKFIIATTMQTMITSELMNIINLKILKTSHYTRHLEMLWNFSPYDERNITEAYPHLPAILIYMTSAMNREAERST